MKMKRRASFFLAAFAAFASLARPEPLENAWLQGTTDKSPISYKPGETMVFTIEPQGINGDIPAGAYFLKWTRSGDDGVS